EDGDGGAEGLAGDGGAGLGGEGQLGGGAGDGRGGEGQGAAGQARRGGGGGVWGRGRAPGPGAPGGRPRRPCGRPRTPHGAVAPMMEPPPEATAKVTATPGTGLPKASWTRTAGGVPTRVPAGAVWWSPALTTRTVGGPGVTVRVPLTKVMA